jgi:exosortase D (VPLPA-CTERM-specific)
MYESSGQPATGAWRLGWVSFLWFVLGAAAIVVAFWHAISWLMNTWMTRPEFSHGPLMPLIAIFLFWQRRAELARCAIAGSVAGVVLVAFAALVLMIGILGGAYTAQQYAMVLAVTGLLWSYLGARALRVVLAPIMVLVLMIPLPDFILNNLSSQLQLLSSALGVDVIRLFGISVFVEGNVIDLGGYRLQVAEACDGMRYLFPLMTLGLLIAYLYQGRLWQRVCIFIASVPVTVLMNSLRVGVIGVTVDRWGIAMAEGFIHEFQGWMVFLLSAALLLGVAMLLNRLNADKLPWRDRFGLRVLTVPSSQVTQVPPVPKALVTAVLLLLLLAVVTQLLPVRSNQSVMRRSFISFPTELNGWHGRQAALPLQELAVLQLDDYLLADYRDAADTPINLYISYYDHQIDRRVVHSPKACLPGSGWQILSSTVIPVGPRKALANRVLIAKGSDRLLVYYWFDQRGRHLTSEWSVKGYLFWDGVWRGRSDGALVRLVTPVGVTDDLAQADRRLQAFATPLEGVLSAYVPP